MEDARHLVHSNKGVAGIWELKTYSPKVEMWLKDGQLPGKSLENFTREMEIIQNGLKIHTPCRE